MINKVLLVMSFVCAPLLVWADHPDDEVVAVNSVNEVIVTETQEGMVIETADSVRSADSQTVVMATIERPPFVVIQNDGSLRGFSIDLWNRIAERSGIDFVYQLETEFSSMLEEVQTGRVDGAVANITITAERERSMDFSLPIYNSGLQIVVPETTDLFSVWKPLGDRQVWQVLGVLFVIWLLVLHVLWMVGRKHHVLFRNRYPAGLIDAFLWLVMDQLRKDVPYSTQFQLIAAGLRVFTITSMFVVTAVFASYLTIDNLRQDISSYEDLFGKKVAVTKNSSQQRFLESHSIPVVTYATLEEIKVDLEAGVVDAAVLDAPVAQYYAKTDGAGSVVLIDGIFKPEQFGILFNAHHPLRDVVNETLLEMQEDGSYQSIYDSWFGG